MKSVLFISKTFNDFCKNRKVNQKFIIDYYDIEAQKVLHNIGFDIKKSPHIYDESHNAQTTLIDGIYDLDNCSFINKLECKQMLGVVFLCR